MQAAINKTRKVNGKQRTRQISIDGWRIEVNIVAYNTIPNLFGLPTNNKH